jgi:hypothetical protein
MDNRVAFVFTLDALIVDEFVLVDGVSALLVLAVVLGSFVSVYLHLDVVDVQAVRVRRSWNLKVLLPTLRQRWVWLREVRLHLYTLLNLFLVVPQFRISIIFGWRSLNSDWVQIFKVFISHLVQS